MVFSTPCTRRVAGPDHAVPGVFYVVQEALFLGAVQMIVYTGAIMILFLSC